MKKINAIALALVFSAAVVGGCGSSPTPEQCAAAGQNVLKVVGAELGGAAENTDQLLRASQVAGDAAKKFAAACPSAATEAVQCITAAKTMADMDACQKQHGR